MNSINFFIVVGFVGIWTAVVLFFVGVVAGSVLRSLRITRQRAEEIDSSVDEFMRRWRR